MPSITGSQALDALQLGLDVAGLTEPFGFAADLLNAGISYGRGDALGGSLSLGAAVPMLGAAATTGKLGLKGAEAGKTVLTQGKTTVYQSFDNLGNVNYVGITDNFSQRAATHLREKGIFIEAIQGLEGISRTDARAVEQVLIETHGLGKSGGTLLNQINSISPSNPIYSDSISRGQQILRGMGY